MAPSFSLERFGSLRLLAALTAKPWIAAALGAICAGLVARFWHLGFPGRLSFDEHHFVENARNYLAGKADWNDHPPLGKLFIASSIGLFGDTPTAWRMTSALFGTATIFMGMELSRRLFRGSVSAALLAGALIAIDGFHLTYSRTALLDHQLAFFALAAVLVGTAAQSLAAWAAVGLLAGLAASVKFSGIAALLPLGFLFLSNKPSQRSLAFCAMAVSFIAIYSAQWIIGLQLTGKFTSLLQVVSETQRLFEQHAVLTKMENPATSAWTSWFVPTNPIVLYRVSEGEFVRTAFSLVNPLIGWSVAAICVFCLMASIWAGWAPSLQPASALPRAKANTPASTTPASKLWRTIWYPHARGFLVPLLGWLGFLAPWVLTRRDSYIYHYLPAYTFGIVLLSGVLAALTSTLHRRVALYYLLAAIVVSGYFAPVWLGVPVSERALSCRMLVRSWR